MDESYRNDMLKSAGLAWKNFKNKLTKDYIRNWFIEQPPEIYDFIDMEVWDRFVAQRNSVEFKVNITHIFIFKFPYN
jgi:hypothetical protein